MTGVSEILVLILLVSGILILPRMFKPAPRERHPQKSPGLSLQIRLGIVLSALYPILLALVLKPWKTHLILYVFLGILPVALAWAIVWILAGRKG